MARFPTILRRRPWPPAWHHGAATRVRGQVLVEHPDPAVRDLLARGLARHGYRTVTCGGPGADERQGPCPLLVGQACPAVAGADAVVFGLDRRDPDCRTVFEAVHELHDPQRILPVTQPLTRLPDGVAVSEHTLNRTVVAPLVRRLYDALEPTSSTRSTS